MKSHRLRYSNKIATASVWAAAFLFACTAMGQVPGEAIYEAEHPLREKARIERKIAKGELHIYKFTLKRGDLVRIKVEQKGIDIAAAIARDVPGRPVLKEVNAVKGIDGSETFVFVPETPGVHIFGVFGLGPDGAEGMYLLQNTADLSPAETASAAASLESSGTAAYEKGDDNNAVMYREHALKLRQELPESAELATVMFDLASAYVGLQDFERGADHYLKVSAIYNRLGNRNAEGVSLLYGGAAFAALKNYERATALYHDASRIFAETKDPVNGAAVLMRLGDNEYSLSEYEKALATYQKALSAYRDLKDKSGEGTIWLRIGSTRTALETPSIAIPDFQKALALFREIQSRRDEGHALIGTSYAHFLLNDHRQALADGFLALKISREIKDRYLELLGLRGAGNAQLMLGMYDEALGSHRQSLVIARELKSIPEEAVSIATIGVVFAERGNYDEAVRHYLDAIALDKKTKDTDSESINLANLGEIYMRLGNLKKAEETTLQSVNLRVGKRVRNGDSFTFTNLGTIYMRLKQPDKAAQYFEKALDVVKGKTAAFQTIYAKIYYGKLLREQGKVARSIKMHGEAVDLARSLKITKYESFADYELSLGHLAQNKPKLAIAGFERALASARAVNARDQAAAALDGLMSAWNRQGNKNLAIFFGKQSINLLQETRGDVAKIDKETQTHFVKDNEQTYRQLAEILVAEGRLPEAQQVLDMLKEEELTGFVRRDSKEIESLAKRVDLRAHERSALEKYSTISARITAVGTELTVLDDKKRRLAPGDVFPEQARYDELSAQIKAANAAFRIFLEKELAAELGREKKREVEADRALQGKLRQWGSGTVALATMVGDSRYRVILTTPNAQVDGKTEITAANLNQKIFQFREALLNPAVDPRPLGKELYDILVKPIEKDLAAANATTLLWSLDGTLRYIPVAALWDGNRYLVEKYQNVVLTSTTRQSLLAEVNKDWSILGAGVTKASKVTDAASRTIAFDELQGVVKELSSILGDSSASAPGVSLLDSTFTEAALKRELSQLTGEKRKYNVVHFATHFRLGSDTGDSFLLLGNDKTLTLADVADSPEMNLTDVELVTLSACNTGFGALESNTSLAENNGKEVDSLAQFIELRGAKSVMATLWAVIDDSTALLMGEFYRLRKLNPSWTKSETLRQAQLAILTGAKKGEPGAARRSDPIDMGDSGPKQPAFVIDPAKPFAHPHYWAPFVMIGNWR